MTLFGRPTREDDKRAAAWASWLHQRNPLAIASLVLGVFSLIEFGALLVFGIAGIILGAIALLQLRRAARAGVRAPVAHRLRAAKAPSDAIAYADRSVPESAPIDRYELLPSNIVPARGQGLAWSGIVLSAASLILAAALYLLPRHAIGGGAP